MKRISSRRAKACAITDAVRRRVYTRDEWTCKLEGPNCAHDRMLTPAHVVSAGKSGLGIEENLITACIPCHRIFDSGTKEERKAMNDKAVAYLRSKYPNFDKTPKVYRKYDF